MPIKVANTHTHAHTNATILIIVLFGLNVRYPPNNVHCNIDIPPPPLHMILNVVHDLSTFSLRPEIKVKKRKISAAKIRVVLGVVVGVEIILVVVEA